MQTTLEIAIWILIGGVLVVACMYACKSGLEEKKSDQISYATRASSTRQDRKKYLSASATQTIQLVMCPECEATIHADEAICPHCGSPRPICTVCHHAIKYGETVLLCPRCKGKAHRVHFLEYLKVKGACPHCQADLDEFELLESDLHSDDQKK